MNRILILAAFIGLLLVSTSLAGFVVTRSSPIDLGGGLSSIDFYARNTGGASGIKLVAAELFLTSRIRGNMIWRATSNGRPDILNLPDLPNRSFLRIDPNPSDDFGLVNVTVPWPLIGPDIMSMPIHGSAAVGTLVGGVVATADNGVRFGRLVFTNDFTGTITGKVAGEVGPGYSYGPYDIVLPEPTSIAILSGTAILFARRRHAELK